MIDGLGCWIREDSFMFNNTQLVANSYEKAMVIKNGGVSSRWKKKSHFSICKKGTEGKDIQSLANYFRNHC